MDADLDGVAAISNSLTLADVGDAAAEQGFLVSGYDTEKYRVLLDKTDLFFVAESDGAIAGFLLAFDSTAIGSDETINSVLKHGLFRPFVLIKQIAVGKAYVRQGVAGRLYAHLMGIEGNKDFAAAIVTEPRNSASIGFHEKYGFSHVLDFEAPPDADGEIRPRGIWLRPSGSGSAFRFHFPDHDIDVGRLFEKQHDLITLYLHEDNLNWTKFEHLVGYMLAHFAGLAFMVDNRPEPYALSGAVFLIITGFMTIYLFHKKLDSGTRFMSTHKKNLLKVEDMIARLDSRLPRCLDGHDGNLDGIDVRNVSATVNILKIIPRIIFVLWLIVGVFAVLYIAN